MFRCFFFFSSRRRHTRSLCDWSSDVCSSDLRVRVPVVVLDPLHVVALEELGDAEHALGAEVVVEVETQADLQDRKSTRLNSSHTVISYAVFCLKKKKKKNENKLSNEIRTKL